MVALSLILLQTLFLFKGINGWSYRTPCAEVSSFRCDDGECIEKSQWCDYSRNCDDNSDEKYCRRGDFVDEDCGPMHYRCESNHVCIPIEGRCDGYTSCADSSDEKDCPCEEIRDAEGYIQNEVFLEEFRTYNLCWKLVLEEGEYVNVTIKGNFFPRDCSLVNITVESGSSEEVEPFTHSISQRINPLEKTRYLVDTFDFICPLTTQQRSFTLYKDVRIRYRSSVFFGDRYMKDTFSIRYVKVDRECLNPDAFKCSPSSCITPEKQCDGHKDCGNGLDEQNCVDRECLNPDAFKCSPSSCIMPEKQCDGHKDCENGLDEQNCDFAAFSATYLTTNRFNATWWIRSQRNDDWGWNANTHRATVALYLVNDLTFFWPDNEDDLIAKQLELEVSTHLLRNEQDKITSTELSSYINALLAICHNPRNFFGFDLVQKLKSEMEKQQDYTTPLPWLTLCNAKESISERVIDSLLQNLQKPSDLGFILEIQALSIMALTCISSDDQYAYLKQNITEALKTLKSEQKDDGSFGNDCTTALVLQAWIANNQANDKDWKLKFKSSIEYLRQKQRMDGSFGDFLTTYLVMPILNAKSLVDLGKVNCTKRLIRPKESNVISDIKSRLGGKIPVKYSLFVGDQKDQVHPIFLRTPENITAFELMELAADIDPKYKFKTHEIRKKKYVYEIFNIPNDPENNKFWFIFHNVGNETVLATTQAPDELYVHEKDHIIMWYKSLNTVEQILNK